MVYANSRLLYGGVQHNPPSRFLSEIDGEFQATATDNHYGYDNEPTYSFEDVQQHPDEPRYVPELREGDAVKHQLFGVGTVVDLDGDTATIYFKGKGTRKLNIAFAPLQKL